jgi:hypothetical protein
MAPLFPIAAHQLKLLHYSLSQLPPALILFTADLAQDVVRWIKHCYTGHSVHNVHRRGSMDHVRILVCAAHAPVFAPLHFPFGHGDCCPRRIPLLIASFRFKSRQQQQQLQTPPTQKIVLKLLVIPLVLATTSQLCMKALYSKPHHRPLPVFRSISIIISRDLSP